MSTLTGPLSVTVTRVLWAMGISSVRKLALKLVFMANVHLAQITNVFVIWAGLGRTAVWIVGVMGTPGAI